MPLAASIPTYIKALTEVYANTANTPPQTAEGVAKATKDWAVTGIPMTLNTGVPAKGLAGGQPVSGNVTAAPGSVTGDGLGGIDVPAPGTGLAAAKPILKAAIEAIFLNKATTAVLTSTGIANAVLAFFSQAQIMTQIVGTIPPGVSVPASSGPVGPGSYVGKGIGGVDKAAPGMGYDAAIAIFIASLTTVYANVLISESDSAAGMADAFEAFFRETKVDTQDAGSAGGGPASVSSESGSGSTLPPGSPIISGASTGGSLS